MIRIINYQDANHTIPASGIPLPPHLQEDVDWANRSDSLGDAVESFLASHGVTKEWWAEFLKEHGLPPCNCTANQEWLNKTAAAHPTIANIGVKFLAAITRKKP